MCAKWICFQYAIAFVWELRLTVSIPVRFDWYSQNGELLVENRGFSTNSYGQDLTNLTTLANRVAECPISEHQKYIHPQVRYAVPLSAPDYMFDLSDLSYVLPNNFKDQK